MNVVTFDIRLWDDLPMRMRTIEFNFEPANYEAAGSLMWQWFAEGWSASGGWLRQALDEHPLPDKEVTEDLHAAQVRKHYPAVGLPFLLLAARLDEGREQNWNRLYTPTAWQDFLAVTEVAPHMAAMVSGGVVVDDDPMLPPRTPGPPRFNAAAWLYSAPLRLTLEMRAEAEFLAGEAVDAFLDRFTREGLHTSIADSVTER